jgi:hypothetical protein
VLPDAAGLTAGDDIQTRLTIQGTTAFQHVLARDRELIPLPYRGADTATQCQKETFQAFSFLGWDAHQRRPCQMRCRRSTGPLLL